jgi:hypothetical protein
MFVVLLPSIGQFLLLCPTAPSLRLFAPRSLRRMAIHSVLIRHPLSVVQTSFLVGCPPTAPSLRVLLTSAFVLLKVRLPECASGTGGLFSSSPALSMGFWPLFSHQLDGRPWNPSLWLYWLSPGMFPATPLWPSHTEPLLLRYIEWEFWVPVQSCISIQHSRCYNVHYCWYNISLQPTTFSSSRSCVYYAYIDISQNVLKALTLIIPQDKTLRHLCPHFAFHQNSNLLCVRKELISLIKLVKNSNLDNLYSKPECHVVSEAFSMFKNIIAVDILLFKLRVTWSASYIAVLSCDVHGWQIVLD